MSTRLCCAAAAVVLAGVAGGCRSAPEAVSEAPTAVDVAPAPPGPPSLVVGDAVALALYQSEWPVIAGVTGPVAPIASVVPAE